MNIELAIGKENQCDLGPAFELVRGPYIVTTQGPVVLLSDDRIEIARRINKAGEHFTARRTLIRPNGERIDIGVEDTPRLAVDRIERRT